jgi:hypothetical protein
MSPCLPISSNLSDIRRNTCVVVSFQSVSHFSICYATTMFVRFRETGTSLQATLVETRRVDGKVRHEHVATLGSIPWPADTAARIMFWKKLHERLAKLANRLTDEQRPPSAQGNLGEPRNLILHRLPVCADPDVQGCAFHFACPLTANVARRDFHLLI